MSDEMRQLKRDFLPEDLEPLLKSIGFDGCIAVQARQTLEETRWLLELAQRHAFIKGVVGWVDLCSPDVRRQLETLAAHAKFVGVRHMVQDEPDDEFILRAEFLNGIAQLRGFDLTYDLLLYPRHLRSAAGAAGDGAMVYLCNAAPIVAAAWTPMMLAPAGLKCTESS